MCLSFEQATMERIDFPLNVWICVWISANGCKQIQLKYVLWLFGAESTVGLASIHKNCG